MKKEDIGTITDAPALDEIAAAGWIVAGPRNEPDKDTRSAKRFFERGKEFIPEHVLVADGFDLVPPSAFTKGYQLAFKDDGQLVRYLKSNYALRHEGEEVPLYVLLTEEYGLDD